MTCVYFQFISCRYKIICQCQSTSMFWESEAVLKYFLEAKVSKILFCKVVVFWNKSCHLKSIYIGWILENKIAVKSLGSGND